MATRSERRIAAAARLVRLVLDGLDVPLAVRLWDGTLVAPAAGAPRVTLAFRSRRVFRRLFARPTPLRFGEAFIASEIDLEGDIFEALRATHRLEDARWGLGTRLAMWGAWLRT
ncbi:MAG TPA: hypothetical protein VNO26_11570 [Candidatus Limnocylindria bacterium]|nr:hypothetical protein [Candidatus Limnocylindria bacterium]